MKVIEVRKAIQSLLKTVHPRVYFEAADKSKIYPYLVYDLPNSIDDGTMENFVLEVDGWDQPEDGDTTEIEMLMGAIDEVLHKAVLRPPGMALIICRDNRLSLRDDDDRIRRRKYRYQVRTFGG